MSVELSVASQPPHRPNNVGPIIATILLNGGLLLLGGKARVPSETLALFAGLWPATCLLLAKLAGWSWPKG